MRDSIEATGKVLEKFDSVARQKILKWIENASRIQESLKSTLDSLRKDAPISSL